MLLLHTQCLQLVLYGSFTNAMDGDGDTLSMVGIEAGVEIGLKTDQS